MAKRTFRNTYVGSRVKLKPEQAVLVVVRHTRAAGRAENARQYVERLAQSCA